MWILHANTNKDKLKKVKNFIKNFKIKKNCPRLVSNVVYSLKVKINFDFLS
jgi:hypothetical protein